METINNARRPEDYSEISLKTHSLALTAANTWTKFELPSFRFLQILKAGGEISFKGNVGSGIEGIPVGLTVPFGIRGGAYRGILYVKSTKIETITVLVADSRDEMAYGLVSLGFASATSPTGLRVQGFDPFNTSYGSITVAPNPITIAAMGPSNTLVPFRRLSDEYNVAMSPANYGLTISDTQLLGGTAYYIANPTATDIHLDVPTVVAGSFDLVGWVDSGRSGRMVMLKPNISALGVYDAEIAGYNALALNPTANYDMTGGVLYASLYRR